MSDFEYLSLAEYEEQRNNFEARLRMDELKEVGGPGDGKVVTVYATGNEMGRNDSERAVKFTGQIEMIDQSPENIGHKLIGGVALNLLVVSSEFPCRSTMIDKWLILAHPDLQRPINHTEPLYPGEPAINWISRVPRTAGSRGRVRLGFLSDWVDPNTSGLI